MTLSKEFQQPLGIVSIPTTQPPPAESQRRSSRVPNAGFRNRLLARLWPFWATVEGSSSLRAGAHQQISSPHGGSATWKNPAVRTTNLNENGSQLDFGQFANFDQVIEIKGLVSPTRILLVWLNT